MRVLVLGLPKTGTSAVWARLFNNLPDHEDDFEKTSKTGDRVVRKILYTPGLDLSWHQSFNKKIWLVRDPRDRIISSVLYVSSRHRRLDHDFLSLLRQKETDPASVPVKDLVIKVFGEARYHEPYYQAEYQQIGHEFYLLKYESYVDNKQILDTYIGQSLDLPDNLDEVRTRVERTKSHGDWRHWFTKTDVDFFRGLCKEYMDFFGYPDDWETAQTPVIRPEHCSQYYMRVSGGVSLL